MKNLLKRKIASIFLAFSLALASIATLPMNVFAETGKNSVLRVDFSLNKDMTIADVTGWRRSLKPAITMLPTWLVVDGESAPIDSLTSQLIGLFKKYNNVLKKGKQVAIKTYGFVATERITQTVDYFTNSGHISVKPRIIDERK